MQPHHPLHIALVSKLKNLSVETNAADMFARKACLTQLEKGQLFCRLGECKGFAFLARGSVVTRHNFGQGLEIYSGNKTANNFLITSLKDILPVARTDYLCMEPAQIFHWKIQDQHHFLNEQPDFYHQLIKHHILKLSVISELGYLRSMLNKRDYAILTMLLMFAADAKQQERSYHVPQSILCNHIGMTRQYYGKLIGELESKGIISTKYKQIELRDFQALRNELQQDVLDHFINIPGLSALQN